jgi:hypothetical protein
MATALQAAEKKGVDRDHEHIYTHCQWVWPGAWQFSANARTGLVVHRRQTRLVVRDFTCQSAHQALVATN